MEETGFEEVFQNLVGKVVDYGNPGCDNDGVPVERHERLQQFRQEVIMAFSKKTGREYQSRRDNGYRTTKYPKVGQEAASQRGERSSPRWRTCRSRLADCANLGTRRCS